MAALTLTPPPWRRPWRATSGRSAPTSRDRRGDARRRAGPLVDRDLTTGCRCRPVLTWGWRVSSPATLFRRSHVATHQIEVMIPKDRRLVVEVPETIRSGPATLILVTSSAGPLEAEELPESTRIEARNRWQAARAELARDSRPFRRLPPEQRRDRFGALQARVRCPHSSS